MSKDLFFKVVVPSNVFSPSQDIDKLAIGRNILIYPLSNALQMKLNDSGIIVPSIATKAVTKMGLVVACGKWYYSKEARKYCEHFVKPGDILVLDKRGWMMPPQPELKSYRYVRDSDIVGVIPGEQFEQKILTNKNIKLQI